MKPSNIFVIASFIFTLYLFVIVVYEVYTGNLPSDDRKTIENISHKYGPDFLPHAYGSGSSYQFVYCMDEDSNFNYTYPEGTACNKDPNNQDDYISQYSYDKDDKDKDKVKSKEKDKEEDKNEDEKYSIQICPPKCPKDYAQDEDDEEEDDEYEDKDEDEDKKE